MKKKHTSTIASMWNFLEKKDYIPIVATILITPICYTVPVAHYSIWQVSNIAKLKYDVEPNTSSIKITSKHDMCWRECLNVKVHIHTTKASTKPFRLPVVYKSEALQYPNACGHGPLHPNMTPLNQMH